MLELSNIFTNGNKWLYDALSKEKQPVLPNDYRLEILYTQDHYENDGSGKALKQLIEYIKLLDFPEFFIYIHTNNTTIRQDLKQFNSNINVIEIDGKFKHIEKTYDSLCVLPWIHFYINPQGQIGSCCEFNEKHEIGNLNKDQLIDIPNNAKFKKIRSDMLQNKRPEICSSCWHAEDNNIKSMRLQMNSKFKDHLPLTKQTQQDGTFDNFKLRYLDFRASNVCNLMCRMCGGKFSSKIAQEEKEIYGNQQYVELKLTDDQISKTLNYIEQNINDLDQIYFAGGEPLLMNEHYLILDLLLKYNKTDISIGYNTNLTRLTYKSVNIVEYWQQFKNVYVGASIDLIGPQADYWRSGTDYKVIEENYHAIKNYVNFNIASTVHMANIFNLPQLQQHWITNFGLTPNQFNVSILKYPKDQSLQVLPNEFKVKASINTQGHIGWLETISGSELLVKQWHDVLQYMNRSDESHLLGEFFRLNDDKDRNRNQSFENVFPEFKELRSYA